MNVNTIYAAGLFDGEGTITLSHNLKKDKYRAPTVLLCSTSYELLDFLKTNFNGCICTKKVYKPHHKPNWTWGLASDKAILFISQIRPYVKEKAKQYRIDLILNEYKKLTPRNGQYTEEMRQKKLDFEDRFFQSPVS